MVLAVLELLNMPEDKLARKYYCKKKKCEICYSSEAVFFPQNSKWHSYLACILTFSAFIHQVSGFSNSWEIKSHDQGERVIQ